MKKLQWLAISFALLLGSAQTARAALLYTLTDLGTFGGTSSSARAINESGQIVGMAGIRGDIANHAFLYSGGRMIDLGTLQGGPEDNSYAHGINDSAQVVGNSDTSIGYYHGFLYSGGTMTDLGTLGGAHSTAEAINDTGQVVGTAEMTDWGDSHAFLYSGGRMTDLGTLGGTSSKAFGINDSGQVVGDARTTGHAARRAFLYSGGRMTDLGTLGGTNSTAYGINDRGEVVGRAETAAESDHAFLYSNGTMTDLGTLGGTSSMAFGINDSRQVVGAARTTGDAASGHAFLYSGGRMTDLNDLIDPASGWVLGIARDINNSGQIAGTGSHNGNVRAFLLTPIHAIAGVPEYEWRRGCSPTSATMMIAYWDQNGYPNLWTGTPPTSNDPADDADPVNIVIEHMGELMGTTTDGTGSTNPSNIPKALRDFAQERDSTYKFKSGNKYVSDGVFTLDYLKTEIDAARPMHVGVKGDQLDTDPRNRWGHSVVAYGYEDNPGTHDDWIAVRDTWLDGDSNGYDGIVAKVEGGIEWWKWVTDTTEDFYIYRGGWLIPASQKHAVWGILESTFSSETAFEEQFDIQAGPSGGASLVTLTASPEELAVRLLAEGAEGVDDCLLASWIPMADRLGVSFDYAFETPGTLQVLIDGVLMGEVMDALGVGLVDEPSDFHAFWQEFVVSNWGLEPDETYQLELRLFAGSHHVAFLDNLQITDLDAASIPEGSTLRMLFFGLIVTTGCKLRKRESKRGRS